MIKVFIGYDEREPVAYHTCVDSIIRQSSEPLQITPLSLKNFQHFYSEPHTDGSNDFVYSRFLVPYLCGYNGHALYLDGDMVVNTDLAALWARRSAYAAVQVVKHDYQTKAPVKYLGARNENYPKKNWSSVILWNCAHYGNRHLHPDTIKNMSGAELHRFDWLPTDRVSALHPNWNWLAEEYEENNDAHILHYTLGTPCWPEFETCGHANDWHRAYLQMSAAEGTEPLAIAKRATLHGQS
jgi:lipopolysaccharide biosynthesis glycosyltransferase